MTYFLPRRGNAIEAHKAKETGGSTLQSACKAEGEETPLANVRHILWHSRWIHAPIAEISCELIENESFVYCEYDMNYLPFIAPAMITKPRMNMFKQVTKLLAIADVSTPKAKATEKKREVIRTFHKVNYKLI